MRARHLYLHLPFCSSRCGYCDFVTVVGQADLHDAYADALLAELALERSVLAGRLESVYLGGGTPTFTEAPALERLLAALPPAFELNVEANPETVTSELASLLRRAGVDRISLGAQSFSSHLLETLDRRATGDDVRRAFACLRQAGFDNLSLDLIYGIPGQTEADLERDLAAALALEPEHVSTYELEAKPGTRFTHRHGAELARQAQALEGYFELVVQTLTASGYRWYETANFCRAGDRDLRSLHNLGYWRGHDYLGLGVGAVSTLGGERRQNAPWLTGYVAALRDGRAPARTVEVLDRATKAFERVMLGLRLDEPLPTAGLEDALDLDALRQLEELRLVEHEDGAVRLTSRGRLLGGGVTARLLA